MLGKTPLKSNAQWTVGTCWFNPVASATFYGSIPPFTNWMPVVLCQMYHNQC